MRFYQRSLYIALAFAVSPLAAHAADMPDARVLFDHYIKAVGGREALAKSSDGTMKSTLEIVEAGMKGDMTLSGRGKDFVMSINLPNFGETRMGQIDGVAWSIDPQNGPRLLEGKERQQFAQQFDDNYSTRDASLIESAKTTALSDADGRACYRVEIKWKSGDNTADCYGVDDGLLLSTESTVASPMGDIKQVAFLSDYKTYGAVKFPSVSKSKLAGMTQLIKVQSLDATAPAAELFTLPPAIAALVKKAAAAKTE